MPAAGTAGTGGTAAQAADVIAVCVSERKGTRKRPVEAIELAVEAGAVRETVEIIEMEDVPLAYYPGNTNRVKIKAAGDLS